MKSSKRIFSAGSIKNFKREQVLGDSYCYSFDVVFTDDGCNGAFLTHSHTVTINCLSEYGTVWASGSNANLDDLEELLAIRKIISKKWAKASLAIHQKELSHGYVIDAFLSKDFLRTDAQMLDDIASRADIQVYRQQETDVRVASLRQELASL